MARKGYSVYVIELSKRVFTEHTRFRNANPQFNGALQCLYVGMTSRNPKDRFDQHLKGGISKRGIKLSSKIVAKYGLYLRPSLYNHLEKMNKNEALKMEEELSLKLRREGYAVWFN